MRLISELKRRNVFRMAVLYVAAAWAIMQLAEVLSSLLPGVLPDWFGAVTLGILAVGFPIALALSWLYEITPEGVTLDKDVKPGAAAPVIGRRIDFIIIAVMAAALLLFAYDKWWTGPPPERSVAVLPFVNMSPDEESAYFAAGVADTILNMLAQVPGLHVAARTSSFQPRLNGLGAGEIAALLGVSAILEGSVQRQGNRLRITAQLINAEDESHLWSRNFDREYGDVFAIQDEIAAAVTSALQLSLQSDTRQRIDREGTDNLEAFEAYSRAMENLRSSTTESVQRAVEQLQRAIELDPDFARAHAMLGLTYFDPRYSVWSNLDDEEIELLAREEADLALEIAPGMSTALTLLGHLTEDDDAREQLYREAVHNGPNDPLALQGYANYLLFKFRTSEATEISQRLISLDPLDEANYVPLILHHIFTRRSDAALETAARGKEKIPDSVTLRDLAALAYLGTGDYRSAIVSNYETLELDRQDYWNRTRIGSIYLNVGMPDEAAQWNESAAAHSPDDIAIHIREISQTLLDMYNQRRDMEVFATLQRLLSDGDYPMRIFEGQPLWSFVDYGARLGKLDEVLDTFEKLYPHLLAESTTDFNEYLAPGIHNQVFATALALLLHGDVERGEPMARAYLEYLDKRDPNTFVHFYYVPLHLALGERDAALEKFRMFSERNKWYLAGNILQFMLRHSELFDSIRDEPEFIELLAVYEQNAVEQRRLLQAMDLPVK